MFEIFASQEKNDVAATEESFAVDGDIPIFTEEFLNYNKGNSYTECILHYSARGQFFVISL